ncbi:MAG: hypothetical protein LUH22_13615 [Bacteroides sp.]|nr:hypothetical protein [Bacteroides sp.]
MKHNLTRFALAILLLSVSTLLWSNMGAPYIRGSRLSEVYSSRDVDILSEQLHIEILSYDKAVYRIIYTVKSDKGGVQIPLLFDTMSSEVDEFTVYVNQQEVPTLQQPYDLPKLEMVLWKDSLRRHFNADKQFSIEHFKYLEAPLEEGINTIQVTYQVKPTIFVKKLIREYEFDYNLEPARYWRSFGKLDIHLDTRKLNAPVQVAFHNDTVRVDSVYSWHYDTLPDTGISILYQPKVSKQADFLIRYLPPVNIYYLSFVLLGLLHLFFSVRYRRKHPKRKFSPVLIGGAFLVPFLAITLWIASYEWIDTVIGEFASRRHGYIIFTYVLYPFIVPVYWLVIWMLTRITVRIMSRKK